MAGPNGTSASDGKDNMCPVCKTSTYLNPRMTFLVNPECYHKMCDACVERIFSSGPAKCPVAGCRKTLRRQKFKVPRFEDLQIERDVDIRARVERVLNRREDEFETLRAYNDFLEWKEELVQNLVHGTDLDATEKLLRDYAREHADEIAANAEGAALSREAVAARETARRERAARARAQAVREADEERHARAAGQRAVVDRIVEAQGDPARAAREAEAAATTRRRAMRAAARRGENLADLDGADGAAAPAFVIPGLKKKTADAEAEPEKPYDPFDGLQLSMWYYTLQDTYHHAWSTKLADGPDHAAGGYRPMDYQRRAIFEGHAGLGIILTKEKAAPEVKA